ncbi:MAG: AAA family ATPase [Alphaproteobacteria bacterium]|nr:AAA family ATPase [Alphaproteobacteria bacterium]
MEQFLINALNAHQIELPRQIIPDGFTRWGHHNQYWLIQCGDGYAFGDWVSGDRFYAFPDSTYELSPDEKRDLNIKIAKQRELFIKEQQQAQQTVAETAQREYDKMGTAPDAHPYLKCKCVSAGPAKYNPKTDSLVVPLYDTDDKLWSLQYISTNGDKRFMAGGRKKGCFCPFGTPGDTIVICEGFATAASIYAAVGEYTVAAMDAGNLEPVAQSIRAKYPNARIVIAADNDWEKDKNTGVDYATNAANSINAQLCIPNITTHGMSDFNDIAVYQGLDKVKSEIVAVLALTMRPLTGGYRIINAADFLRQELPPTEYVLYPMIPENGLSLLYAERGAGKTFMALAIACAVAGGFEFLNFRANKPRKVLYIDGEMDANEMQTRLNLLINGFASEGKIVIRENIRLFLSGLQDNATMPDIAKTEGQKHIEAFTNDVSLIIIDNIFSLYTAGHENDADSWTGYNAWSRKMRSKGKSILWLHHTGKDKNRGPRGSSAIEAILNSSIALEVSPAHKTSDGADILVEYHKSRGICGDDVKPFAAKLVSVKDEYGKTVGLKWVLQDTPAESVHKRIIELRNSGKTIIEIADETGISKSKVQRILSEHSA